MAYYGKVLCDVIDHNDADKELDTMVTARRHMTTLHVVGK